MACALAALALMPLAARADEAVAEAPDETGRWIAVLEKGDASEDERRQAVERLRAAAAGEPGEASTREAVFSLARHLRDDSIVSDRERRRLMALAATLYPHDPRTPEILVDLGPAQLEAGDRFGAHLSFVTLFRSGYPATDTVRALAAENAVAVDDLNAAFLWSRPFDVDALAPDLRARVLLARVAASAAVGRNDLAREAANRLENEMPERLGADAAALLAAARADEAIGDLGSAVARYRAFAERHDQHERRAAALLALGRVLRRTGDVEGAREVLEQLVSDYPAATERTAARLELIELDPRGPANVRLADYAEVIREASTSSAVRSACDRLLERSIGAGRPREGVAVLAAIARGEETGLAAVGARGALRRGREAVLETLISRQDTLGVVAVALDLESVGIPVRRKHRDAVADARIAFGLDTPPVTLLEDALDRARPLARAGDWQRAAALLEDALMLEPRPAPAVLARARLLTAEADFWLGRQDTAVRQLDDALAHEGVPDAERRALRVLRADIHFAAGRRAEACDDYRSAAAIGGTPWVERQLERCGTPDAAAAVRASAEDP